MTERSKNEWLINPRMRVIIDSGMAVSFAVGIFVMGMLWSDLKHDIKDLQEQRDEMKRTNERQWTRIVDVEQIANETSSTLKHMNRQLNRLTDHIIDGGRNNGR